MSRRIGLLLPDAYTQAAGALVPPVVLVPRLISLLVFLLAQSGVRRFSCFRFSYTLPSPSTSVSWLSWLPNGLEPKSFKVRATEGGHAECSCTCHEGFSVCAHIHTYHCILMYVCPSMCVCVHVFIPDNGKSSPQPYPPKHTDLSFPESCIGNAFKGLSEFTHSPLNAVLPFIQPE